MLVTSVLSLCDSKGLASNLSVTVTSLLRLSGCLALYEAFQTGASQVPKASTSRTSARLIQFGTCISRTTIYYLSVCTQHTYEAANLQCMLSGIAKRKRKMHSSIIKIRLELQWHAFALSHSEGKHRRCAVYKNIRFVAR